MERQRKLFIAKTAVILAAVPILIWAHEYGPDPGYSGVPKELGTCAQAGCHVGTANNPANKGSVTVALPNGTTYTPGVKQHWVVTIADPATTQKAWGFQLTTRLASSTSTQEGSFTSSDANTQVICADPNLFKQLPLLFPNAQTCPGGEPLSYIEHTLTGYQSSLGKTGSFTYQFDWTPPSTNVGNITIYVAGNAANGDLAIGGDHIYTATYTLTPQAAGDSPTITKVVSASGFGGFAAAAPGTWIEITGNNLAGNTRPWAGSDFSGVNAPTSLDGTSVTVGGQTCFLNYISPTQVNALLPFNVSTGTQAVVVTNGSTPSAAFNITINALEPGMLAPSDLPPWGGGSKQYVIAQLCDKPNGACLAATDWTFVMPNGTSIPGYPVRAAKAGDVITIYGIGFGPAKDSSNLAIPSGQIVQVANQLTNPIQVQVNGVNANVTYQGLGPGLVGGYQINFVMPSVPAGDWPVTFTQNGVKSTQNILLSAQ